MNYIYDVLINFNKGNYDFFDWELDDNICHIRKIPLFKVSSNDLLNISNSIIQVDKDFLDAIKNRTELFSNRTIKKIEYACIFSDKNSTLAVKFNESGVSNSKSRMLIDEEIEVLEVIEKIEDNNIVYKILNTENNISFKTRNEISTYNYLLKEIRKLDKQQNINKLKYLYFDCFNEKEESRERIVRKLEKSLNESFDEVNFKMYNFFKLTSVLNEEKV